MSIEHHLPPEDIVRIPAYKNLMDWVAEVDRDNRRSLQVAQVVDDFGAMSLGVIRHGDVETFLTGRNEDRNLFIWCNHIWRPEYTKFDGHRWKVLKDLDYLITSLEKTEAEPLELHTDLIVGVTAKSYLDDMPDIERWSQVKFFGKIGLDETRFIFGERVQKASKN